MLFCGLSDQGRPRTDEYQCASARTRQVVASTSHDGRGHEPSRDILDRRYQVVSSEALLVKNTGCWICDLRRPSESPRPSTSGSPRSGRQPRNGRGAYWPGLGAEQAASEIPSEFAGTATHEPELGVDIEDARRAKGNAPAEVCLGWAPDAVERPCAGKRFCYPASPNHLLERTTRISILRTRPNAYLPVTPAHPHFNNHNTPLTKFRRWLHHYPRIPHHHEVNRRSKSQFIHLSHHSSTILESS